MRRAAGREYGLARAFLCFGGGGGGASRAAHLRCVTASDRCTIRPFSGSVCPNGLDTRMLGRLGGGVIGGVGGGVGNDGVALFMSMPRTRASTSSSNSWRLLMFFVFYCF